MRITRTITYGIQALLLLANRKGRAPVSCRQLAQQGQMPERFLLQILRRLVTHGLVISTRGVEGGYILSRPANEITLMNVLDSFDHIYVSSVPVMDGMPDTTAAQLNKVFKTADAALRTLFAQVSLADLADGHSSD